MSQLSQSDKINGHWGMAINDQGNEAQLFVSNVLDGTITRLEVSFEHGSFTVAGPPLTIAHGYRFGLDPTAVVVGPAGLAYDSNNDVLYVASELDNEIFALDGAGKTTSDLGTGNVVVGQLGSWALRSRLVARRTISRLWDLGRRPRPSCLFNCNFSVDR